MPFLGTKNPLPPRNVPFLDECPLPAPILARNASLGHEQPFAPTNIPFPDECAPPAPILAQNASLGHEQSLAPMKCPISGQTNPSCTYFGTKCLYGAQTTPCIHEMYHFRMWMNGFACIYFDLLHLFCFEIALLDVELPFVSTYVSFLDGNPLLTFFFSNV